MKPTLLILSLTLAAASAVAQTTNTYVTEKFPATKSKQRVTVCGMSYWQFGQEPVYADTNNALAHFFTPITNALSITATNPLILVRADRMDGGAAFCGLGSVSWNDPGFSSNKWAFLVKWPTNTSCAFPAGLNVPIGGSGFSQLTNNP